MQRGVLLAAGAAVLVIGGVLVMRTVTSQQAGHMLDQNIDQLLARLPPGTKVTHGAVSYNALTGAATVHDLAVSEVNGTQWTVAVLTVSGADDKALHDVVDPAAYPQGKPAWTDRRKLLGEVTATGVHAVVPGPQPTDMTIAKLTLSNLRGRPFDVPPTPENRKKPAFVADAALTLAFGEETATDIVIASPAPNAAKLSVGSFTVEGYDSGKATSVALRTMAADVTPSPGKPPLNFHLGSMQVSDPDASLLLKAVAGGDAAAEAPKFAYSSWDMSDAGMQVPQGPVVSMQDMHASTQGTGAQSSGKAVMTALTLALGQTQVPASTAPMLAAFGMNAITTDVTATTTGSPPGIFTVHEDMAFHDLGTLHLDGTVDGYVAPHNVSSDPTQALGALSAATLVHASVVWDDASLTDRLFKVAAQQEHTTPAQVRDQLAIPLMGLGVMVPDQPDAVDQITKFLNHPHRLTVTISPPQKVSLGSVASAPPTSQAHLLGLRIAAD